MFFTETRNDVRSRLARMVQETGREVLDSSEKGDGWTLLVRQDLYHIAIMHAGDAMYMQVVFPARLTDDDILEKIDSALKNPQDRAKFQFLLKQGITTPTSSFRIHLKDDLFAGFDTIVKIFPFEPEFTSSRLDAAIQTAVSAGILGIAFLSGITDGGDLEQQVGMNFAQASPEGMYG